MTGLSKPAENVLLPTDFSEESENAFAHALAIALYNKASLTILHVIKDREDVVQWDQYPSVRKTLTRWGYLDEDSSRKDVATKLGISIRKEVGVDGDVANAIEDYTKVNTCDMIVMSTDANRYLPKWIKPSAALKATELTKLPTLFVPNGATGCVSIEDGSVNLERVLLAVDRKPDPQPVIDRVASVIGRVGGLQATVSLLHVCENNEFPNFNLPENDDIEWNPVCRDGNPADAIIDFAKERQANLIGMVTDGAHGFWETVLGSTMQRVVRGADCPVFALPSY